MKIVRLILLILPVLLYSQVDTAWVRRYNGSSNGNDKANAIVVDDAQNVYVTGSSTGPGSGLDYVTIKYNSIGVEQWEAIYNGTGNSDDVPVAMAIDAYNNIYITGYSVGVGSSYDYATIKYNSDGILQWVKRYNGLANLSDKTTSLILDNSCNVYVTGSSNDTLHDPTCATVKYNNNGVEQWVRIYKRSGSHYDAGKAITIDSNENIYVVGYSAYWNVGNQYDCFATLKYDTLGNLLWARHYANYRYNEDANAVAVDNYGNVYVTGQSTNLSPWYDYATIKYDSAGNELWVRRYTYMQYDYNDIPRSIKIFSGNNIYVTGVSYSSNTGNDYATIKYNSAGDTIWIRRYNGIGNSNDEAIAMTLDDSGNIYITGKSYGIGDSANYATIKYNSNGVQKWVAIYNGPGNRNDIANAITIDRFGNIYVTGESYGLSSNVDYATIKYVQTEAIEENHEPLSTQPLELNVYPNPTSRQTAIHYSLSEKSKVSLQLFDISGRLVKTLVNQEKNTGNYSLIWNGTDDNNRKVGEGVYFCILKSDGKSLKQKILLVK